MKKILALFLLISVILCFVSCGKTDTQEKVTAADETTAAVQNEAETTDETEESSKNAIKIGFIASEKNFDSVVNAVALALDKVNNGDGPEFEIRFEKITDSTLQAEGAYNTLTEWGMQILIENAPTDVSDYLAAKSYTERLFHLALNDSEGGGTFRDNRFKMKNADATASVSITDYITAKYPHSKVAVICNEDNKDFKALCDSLSAEFRKKGKQLSYIGRYGSENPWDFTQQVVSSFESGADIMILLAKTRPASLIIEQSEAIGYKPLFVGIKENSKILSADGFNKKALGNMIFITDFSVKADNKKTADFVSEYKSTYDKKPDSDAAYAYDCVFILGEAITKAEIKRTGMSAEKICKKLLSTMADFAFGGVTGENMHWDKKGEISRISHAEVIKNGKFVY